MLALGAIYVLVIASLLVFTKARYDFLKAKKHYKISKRGDNWVVRDVKGRFVRITNNYWDVCSLGVRL